MRRPARPLWLAIAIAIAIVSVPAVAGADQSSCQPGAGSGGGGSTAGGVNIHVTANNSTVWCSPQVIEGNSDVPDQTNYPVRATSQSPNNNPVSNAISVSRLLTLAGLDPATVNHTELMRLSGDWSLLDRADLVDPAARFAGGLTPIFWINGSETQYLRPLRGPSDTNGDDQIVASGGQPLDVYVYSGPLLSVTGKATPNRVAVRQRITLTAHVSNVATADGTLSFKWAFQDGSTAIGASVTHSYAVSGTWDPVVTVQGRGDDSGGASQPIPVTVGSVPTGGRPGGAGGSNRSKHSHARGPTHSSGSTASTPPSSQGSSGSALQNTPALQPGPPAPAPSAPTQGTSPITSHAGTSSRVRPHPAPGTKLVQGRLIADVIPISAAQLATEGGPSGPARAPAAAPGGGSVTPLGGIAAGSVVVLLLALGAAAELRSQRRSMTPGLSA
jgi:hypothetical protein